MRLFKHALTEEARQAEGDFWLNANPAARFTVVDLNGKSSTSKVTSKQATSVNRSFTEISLQENPSSQMEAAASTPTPVLALAPEINRNNAQANPDAGLLARRQDFARAMGPKARDASNRSSVAFRYVGVKRRLIELWHESLARSEKSRSWTAFSNLNRGVVKPPHRRSGPLTHTASSMEHLRFHRPFATRYSSGHLVAVGSPQCPSSCFDTEALPRMAVRSNTFSRAMSIR